MNGPSPPAPEGEGRVVSRLRDLHDNKPVSVIRNTGTRNPSASGGGAGEREVPAEREVASHSSGFAALSPKQTVWLDRFGSISSKQNEALH